MLFRFIRFYAIYTVGLLMMGMELTKRNKMNLLQPDDPLKQMFKRRIWFVAYIIIFVSIITCFSFGNLWILQITNGNYQVCTGEVKKYIKSEMGEKYDITLIDQNGEEIICKEVYEESVKTGERVKILDNYFVGSAVAETNGQLTNNYRMFYAENPIKKGIVCIYIVLNFVIQWKFYVAERKKIQKNSRKILSVLWGKGLIIYSLILAFGLLNICDNFIVGLMASVFYFIYNVAGLFTAAIKEDLEKKPNIAGSKLEADKCFNTVARESEKSYDAVKCKDRMVASVKRGNKKMMIQYILSIVLILGVIMSGIFLLSPNIMRGIIVLCLYFIIGFAVIKMATDPLKQKNKKAEELELLNCYETEATVVSAAPLMLSYYNTNGEYVTTRGPQLQNKHCKVNRKVHIFLENEKIICIDGVLIV